MKRITFNLDSRNYYVTKYICLGEYLFLLLLDENKEVFSGNVICVNQKFELLHRFERPNASSISTDNHSIILYCSGYQFYFHPSTFEQQRYEWVK